MAKSQQSGNVDLPARVVENEVFVLGSGVEGIVQYLDQLKMLFNILYIFNVLSQLKLKILIDIVIYFIL